ncbi:hypothetical protein AB4Z48_03085 [Cupriavidus sp. 2TAF22]
MIFLQAMLLLIVAPVGVIVVGLLWLWLGHKVLAWLLGGRC